MLLHNLQQKAAGAAASASSCDLSIYVKTDLPSTIFLPLADFSHLLRRGGGLSFGASLRVCNENPGVVHRF